MYKFKSSFFPLLIISGAMVLGAVALFFYTNSGTQFGVTVDLNESDAAMIPFRFPDTGFIILNCTSTDNTHPYCACRLVCQTGSNGTDVAKTFPASRVSESQCVSKNIRGVACRAFKQYQDTPGP